MMDLSKIEFSRNDIKKNIKIPTKLTAELAEDVGFHIGDGYMKKRIDGHGTHYDFTYSGHKPDDIQYFKEVLIPRKKSLFNLNYMKIKNPKPNAIRARFKSKAIFLFYRDVLGVKESPKDKISIPSFIFKSIELQIAFLRGLIDSDGCFTVKKKHYPVIHFSTKSFPLFEDVKKILNNLSFSYGKFIINAYDKRTEKINKKHCLEINGRKNINKWVKIIGFKNIKHMNKYKDWKGRWSSGYDQ